MSLAVPQPTRSGFSTTDPAVAADMLSRLYPGTRLQTAEPGAPVRFEVRSVSAGRLRLDRVRFALEGRAEHEPLDYLLAMAPTGGAIRMGVPGGGGRFVGGSCVLCPLDVPMSFRWSDDFEEIAVPLALDMVTRHAAAVTGIAEKDFAFLGIEPVSPAMGRLWFSTVAYLFRQLHAADSPMAHPLVQAEALSLLAGTLVASFPNSTMTAHHPAQAELASSAARRAMAFIEEHCEEPLTVTDIARAAGIGVRGLQASFARNTGMTPLGYARRVRLERAHAELQSADPDDGTTVRGVAARWGFAKPERFAAIYRQRYGRLPSQTLRGRTSRRPGG